MGCGGVDPNEKKNPPKKASRPERRKEVEDTGPDQT